jgi:hypothetical protein
MTSEAGPTVPAGGEMVGDHVYMRNARGGLEPLELVSAQALLEDEIVRRLSAEAAELRERLVAFRAKCFEEVEIFNALLSDLYKAPRRVGKGNQTLQSYNGLLRLQVQVADQITFGPELDAAKSLVDECLTEWAHDSRAELRALVDHAFQVDKQGQINRGRLFGLLRLTIADERWVRAMQAIRDSIRVTGSKQYIRFHARPNHQAAYSNVSLDIASA